MYTSNEQTDILMAALNYYPSETSVPTVQQSKLVNLKQTKKVTTTEKLWNSPQKNFLTLTRQTDSILADFPCMLLSLLACVPHSE